MVERDDGLGVPTSTGEVEVAVGVFLQSCVRVTHAPDTAQ
jgi:hypothetical protein